MAALRTNQDIIKGSKLMVFYNNAPIGFATSHTLSLTMNTTQVSTKDNGDFPSTLPQNITFEVSAENLYSELGEATYMQIMQSMQPVTLVFAEAANYSNTSAQKGLPMEDNGAEWTVGTKVAEGKALLTSFSINAPAGENATMSVTFTGSGDLTTTFN